MYKQRRSTARFDGVKTAERRDERLAVRSRNATSEPLLLFSLFGPERRHLHSLGWPSPPLHQELQLSLQEQETSTGREGFVLNHHRHFEARARRGKMIDWMIKNKKQNETEQKARADVNRSRPAAPTFLSRLFRMHSASKTCSPTALSSSMSAFHPSRSPLSTEKKNPRGACSPSTLCSGAGGYPSARLQNKGRRGVLS